MRSRIIQENTETIVVGDIQEELDSGVSYAFSRAGDLGELTYSWWTRDSTMKVSEHILMVVYKDDHIGEKERKRRSGDRPINGHVHLHIYVNR